MLYSIQILVVRVDDNGNSLTNYYDTDYAPKVVSSAIVDLSHVDKIVDYLLAEGKWQLDNHNDQLG